MMETDISPIIPLALVHHANQYLITETYDNREGISQIVEGYAAVLHLHEKYRIPFTLHLSGTLIETIAWHRPEFFTLVNELRERRLLNVIGGTYAENVMPLFSAGFNRRQLIEHLWLCQRHLGCTPAEIKICWVPERVWDTEKLAPILTDSSLPNGGYRYVLLDSRHLCSGSPSYPESPRALFDSTGPYDGAAMLRRAREPQCATEPIGTGAFKVHRIAEGHGLSVVPISAELRYWIPPRSPDALHRLDETVDSLAGRGEKNTILVYADDLEKTAGVGGWESGSLARYEAFLEWMTEQKSLAPVPLADWLADQPSPPERPVEPGTFFELAQQWNAGEDYRNWWDSAEWASYRHSLEIAQKAITAASRAGAEPRLLTLARKHLMASAYETAWYDSAQLDYAPAPWAKALASHARSALVIAAAAGWFAQNKRSPASQLIDIDRDGEEEVILKNESLYAIISPSHGGRLIYLFALTPQGGALIVGNPTDDWNLQQELNRYMDWPPNHPGALADLGGLHDRYVITAMTGAGTRIEMRNIEHGSPLFGTGKGFVLLPEAPVLAVCYRLPEGQNGLEVDSCLSPDYYRLLREGRAGLQACAGQDWSGFCNKGVAAWVGLDSEEESTWGQPGDMNPGHGLNVRIQAHGSHFHVLIGCGQTDDAQCGQFMARGRSAFHRVVERLAEKKREVYT